MSQLKDLTGKIFGNIKVLNISQVKVNNRTSWDCECSCGNRFKTNSPRLLNGKTHCGCLTKENTITSNQQRSKDLTNKVVGNLVIIERTEDFKVRNLITWKCKCVCGNICYIETARLINNHTTHCGCKRSENISKALKKNSNKIIKVRKRQSKLSHTSEYRIWTAMKQRCSNSKDISYPNYGGRGIKVCNRWLNSFENFLEDMGNKPTITSSIERISVNKDYEPSNCKWIERNLQNRNTRRSVLTEQIVEEIKQLSTQNLTASEIYHLLKDKYNLSRSNINSIIYQGGWVNG